MNCIFYMDFDGLADLLLYSRLMCWLGGFYMIYLFLRKPERNPDKKPYMKP